MRQFFCLRAPSGPLSRSRSGAAKRDTYRSLHHFVGIEVIWGGACRDRGRKEMGILRRAGSERLRYATALAEPFTCVGAELEILARWSAGASGRDGTRRSLFWKPRKRSMLLFTAQSCSTMSKLLFLDAIRDSWFMSECLSDPESLPVFCH